MPDQIIVIDRGKISLSKVRMTRKLIKQAGIYADFVGMREKSYPIWKIKADGLLQKEFLMDRKN